MTAPFDLVGTTPQNEIVAGALARCDFPFERLSKKNIPVEWLDLSRFMGVRVAGDGHSHDHHVDSYDALEVRGRVLGLAWYSGKISLDLSLIADPELAGEVLISEIAHMVDFFYMTSAHRVAVWNAAHLDDPPLPLDFEPPEDGTAWHHDHGWFDVGSYRHEVGEAFMGLFVLAFSDYLVTIDFPDHPATLEGAALVRAAFAVEGEPPPPSPELESRRGCLPFLRARKSPRPTSER